MKTARKRTETQPGIGQVSRAAANDIASRNIDKKGSPAILKPKTLQFVDNRSKTVALSEIQEKIKASPPIVMQAKHIAGTLKIPKYSPAQTKKDVIQGFWFRGSPIDAFRCPVNYLYQWIDYFLYHADLRHPGVRQALYEISQAIGNENYYDYVNRFQLHPDLIGEALSVNSMGGEYGYGEEPELAPIYLEVRLEPPGDYNPMYFDRNYSSYMEQQSTGYFGEPDYLNRAVISFALKAQESNKSEWALSMLNALFCSESPEGVAQSFVAMPVGSIKAWDDYAYEHPDPNEEPGATAGEYGTVEKITGSFDLAGDLAHIADIVLGLARDRKIKRTHFREIITCAMSTTKNILSMAGQSTAANVPGAGLGVGYGGIRGFDFVRSINRYIDAGRIDDPDIRAELEELIMRRGVRSGTASIAGFLGGVAAILSLAAASGPALPILVTIASICGLGLMIHKIYRRFTKRERGINRWKVAEMVIDYMYDMYAGGRDDQVDHTLKAIKIKSIWRGESKRRRYIDAYIAPQFDRYLPPEKKHIIHRDFVFKIADKLKTWQ